MGIIKAAVHAVKGGLADQWQEVIEPYNMGNTTVMTTGVKVRAKDARNGNRQGTDQTVSNGSVIHVYPNQMMLLVDGGRVIDYSAEPGYYTVDQAAMPSLFNGEFAETLVETFSRIKYGGVPSRAQKVYYINLQEIRGIKFGTRNPINYFDEFYNAELFLRAYGSYSVKIVDPFTFFAEAIPRNSDQVDIFDIHQQYSAEFMTALQSAINRLSADNVRISHVASKGLELSNHMSTVLADDWNRRRGIQIQSVGIESISYNEESQALINLRNKGAMLKDSMIREGYVQGAAARGLEAAGSNASGAMNGFVGLGMGMQGAGEVARTFSDTNREQFHAENQVTRNGKGMSDTVHAYSNAATNAEHWNCGCGQPNSGRFCTECGQAKPTAMSAEWKCSCGQDNTGKFCTECGSKRPEGLAIIKCDKCGFMPPSGANLKFCQECGDPFNEEDRL
ncbi:SPFH domain-containing protein [Paenibacillus agilis]|uniref:Virion core protein n=1 Tax=Paenibacillus agilis TaxID=3020863 RepID=A0A559IKI1_9BACL|nr:SPFH domain-containing protein [Paenibacillus agilis]TVX88175.1 virion core protein [Paenibacillus agilis]